MASGRAWLLTLLEPLRPVVREVLGASLFVNILALAVPIFVMQVYDRVIGHAGIETLKGLFIGVLIMLAFDFILRQSRGRILQTVALKLDVEIGEKLFDKVSNLPLRTLESKPASHWHQLFRDVDTVRNTLSGATAILCADLPFVVIFLGMVFVIGAPLAMVFLIAFVVFIALAWWSSRALSRTAQREKGVVAARDALMAEMIAGRSVIKATGLTPAMRPLWEKHQAGAIESAIHRGAISDGYVNLGMVLTLATTVILTTVGALYIIDQQLTMGALIACNMLSSRMYGPINQLVGAWRSFGSFRESTDRLGEVFAETEDRHDCAIHRERPTGRIRAESVTFHYDPQGAATLTIDRLAIEPGGITALVGRNGSGKSTLLKLLMGLYGPAQGRVLLDGADMAQFSRAELARWIGMVPQETVLFSGTIRDNIALGAPLTDDASRAYDTPLAYDERLLAAARAAGVHDAIIDMPDGYGTEIGEAGTRLSAGQRQRIAIARALVGDPPILLLDEPSASLDRQAEEALRATLLSLSANRTVVVVTHSAVLLPVCRDIIVLDKGRVAAAGPGKDLLPMLFAPLPGSKAPAKPPVPAQ